MKTITINLTDAQEKALLYVATNPEEWANIIATDKARVATDEIAQICFEKCLENNIQVPSTKDAMVVMAYEKGWILTAAERQAKFEAEMAAHLAELAAKQGAQA